MPDVRCSSCGEQVPDGRFCVRCGAELGQGQAQSRDRHQFAAAPNESPRWPRLVSSLFPQLPRSSMLGFRVALGFGAVMVVALAAARLVPVALITAALLLPLLTILYLRDVDVYEDEPVRVVTLTMLWGAIAGIALGLLTRGLTSTGAAYVTQSRGTTILAQGILLPLLGLAVSLLGPIVLLRYRRFNDVLDGVTFGAATAAAFAGAEVITYGFSVLSGGLHAAGAVGELVLRTLTVAVAIPVLEMATVAAVAAAGWLRYRAPVRDRDVLGRLGNPFVALIGAAILIALAFSLQPLMATVWWLLCLLALDALALLWLRRMIHLGLLEEAAEIPIGPPITCVNCGAQTPRHTFCISCGISLQALPKQRPQEGASWRGGERGNRLGGLAIAGVFAVLFVVAGGVVVGISLLAAPAPPTSVCPFHRECANPPRSAPPPAFAALSPALAGERAFVSSGLGYRIEFSSDFTVTDRSATGVVFAPRNGSNFFLSVAGASAANVTPAQLLQAVLTSLRRSVPNLQADSDPKREIPASALGGHAGVGGFYQGTFDSPSGPGSPADVAILSASDGHQTLAVTVLSSDRSQTDSLFGYVDEHMLDTLRFAGDIAR